MELIQSQSAWKIAFLIAIICEVTHGDSQRQVYVDDEDYDEEELKKIVEEFEEESENGKVK